MLDPLMARMASMLRDHDDGAGSGQHSRLSASGLQQLLSGLEKYSKEFAQPDCFKVHPCPIITSISPA